MRLENLFIIQDHGVSPPDNHRVWQSFYKRQTDCLGRVEVERGRLFCDWDQR